MLRLLGLLGLVMAAGFAGMMKAAELKERIALLEEFYKIMLDMKGQMEYFREPLLRMFERTGKKGDNKARSLLTGCLSDLIEKDGEISQIWAENVRHTYRGTPLTSEDKELLCHLGSFIGQTDYENQRMQFSYMEERLGEQIEDAKYTYQKKGPMYRRIGFFCGAIVAIIML